MEIGSYHLNVKEGEELSYSVDFIDSVTLSKNGSHVVWEFIDESTPLINKVKPVNIDYQIEGFNQVFLIDDGFDKRIYAKNYSRIDEVGIELNTRMNTEKRVFYKKPLYFTTRKLIYGAQFSDSTDFEITYTRDELPLEIVNYLPAKVTNIRLIGKVKRKYHYDADGRFEFKNDNISALRLKIDEHVDLFLYDEGSGSRIPVYNENVLSKIYKNYKDKTYYFYFSNEFKLFFAKSFSLDDKDGYIIEYQTENELKYPNSIRSLKKIFVIFPNPTYGEAKIFLNNYREGSYKLQIYNIIGRRIWKEDINVKEKTLLKFDFSFLHKGTYLLALKDRYGNIIATRKLVIISI
ncbi:MAG TPA: T9SS type A sorting domain-containing protein [Saprospiraceae bacterium]|nr:T9SS type A sorting domain-containing protein [Saprospiraceae bacterium]